MKQLLSRMILILTWKRMDAIQYYNYCKKHDIPLDEIPERMKGR